MVETRILRGNLKLFRYKKMKIDCGREMRQCYMPRFLLLLRFNYYTPVYVPLFQLFSSLVCALFSSNAA